MNTQEKAGAKVERLLTRNLEEVAEIITEREGGTHFVGAELLTKDEANKTYTYRLWLMGVKPSQVVEELKWWCKFNSGKFGFSIDCTYNKGQLEVLVK